MAKRDYYQVLEVTRSATDAEIKKAYRRLAMKLHPGPQPGRPRDRGEIQGGQGGLRGALRRAQARRVRPVRPRRRRSRVARRPGGGGFDPRDAFGDIFGDVFGDIFGGGPRAAARRCSAAPTCATNSNSTSSRPCSATPSTSTSRRSVECEECKGTGSAKGSKPVTCETCHGQGQVRMQQGFFTVQQTCPRCQGRGQVVSDPCAKCRGQGRVRKQKTLAVKVPPGVDTGDRIRLSGEGEAGRNGGPHRRPLRRGARHASTRSSSATARTSPARCRSASRPPRSAARIEVPTLDGDVTIKVPAETQSGRVFRLREKGIKPVRGGADRRPVLPRRRGDARAPHARTEGAAEQVRRVAALRPQAPSPARGVVARRREALLHEPRRVRRDARRSRR